MRSETPSRTAMATALMRALHTRADVNPLIHDPWGEIGSRRRASAWRRWPDRQGLRVSTHSYALAPLTPS